MTTSGAAMVLKRLGHSVARGFFSSSCHETRFFMNGETDTKLSPSIRLVSFQAKFSGLPQNYLDLSSVKIESLCRNEYWPKERRMAFAFNTIKKSLINAFRAALDSGIKSIAVPAMATGILGELQSSPELSALAALEAIEVIQSEHPHTKGIKINFVPYQRSVKDAAGYKRAFDMYKKASSEGKNSRCQIYLTKNE